MLINTINVFLKFFALNLCISFTFFKLINDNKIKIIKKSILIIICFSLAITQIFLTYTASKSLRIIFIFFILSFILGKFTKNKLSYCLIITLISISINYIIISFTSFATYTIFTIFTNLHYTNPIITFFIICFYCLNIFFIFKIKRLKNGLPFINKFTKNDYIDMFVIVTTIIIIFIYFLMENYIHISIQHLTIFFIMFSILMIVIIQKTFILYQKQKLLNKTLKEYESELAETKLKLNTALEEKDKLVKTNHEFYHRQEALKLKLNTLLTSQSNYTSETAEEYGYIFDRINKLSKEYTSKIKSTPPLPKTTIAEIDDMFTYMQSECIKNDIEFILTINTNIQDIIEKLIPKSKLETLIGDLIRNSIIAINHSSNKFKSIMVILGFKDNNFELSIHDSGIPFEINTLLSLGTEAITTHKNDGGTGIGFVTTFETLDYCNASLIINENTSSDNTYTKSIVIRFDNKHLYIINSYRADTLIYNKNTNRNIIINKNI